MKLNHISVFKYLLTLLFALCFLLFCTRFYYTFSSLHSLTGGIEDEGLLAIWLTQNTDYFQNHYLNYKLSIVQDLEIFNLFQYNWLWYFLNSELIEIFVNLFNLSDDWFANLIRINNFIFSIISLSFLYLTIAIKSKIKFLNFYLVFLILFGPLTGFWNISAKPDFGYLVFEIFAIYYFLKNINRLNIFKIFIVTLFLYFAWSVKQSSIITSSAIFLYLLIKKDKLIIYYCSIFVFFVILTFLIGGENYINNMLWINAQTEFSFTHFINLLVSSIGKFFPVFVIGMFYLLKCFQNKFQDLKNNNFILFSFLGLISSLFNILLSFHVGSAPNYYFLSSIFLLLFSSEYIAKLYESPNFNLQQLKVINFSIIIQSILIILILSGNIGKIKPNYFNDVKKVRSCFKDVPKPIFFGSNLEYYRLPWINGNYELNPLIKNWFYDRKYSNTPTSQTPIYNLIKNGEFKSLILSENDVKNYVLNMYDLKTTCSINSNFYNYYKIKF